MIKTISAALAVLILALSAVSVSPVFAQLKPTVGGIGAPQAVNCADSGGTMDGTMCKLPSGQSCDAMTLARDGQCVDAEGNIVPAAVLDEVVGKEGGDADQPEAFDPDLNGDGDNAKPKPDGE